MVKICPILTVIRGGVITERVPSPCMQDRCMWWMDGECAIVVIARRLKGLS